MRPRVFISYSHKDEGWKKKLLARLRIADCRLRNDRSFACEELQKAWVLIESCGYRRRKDELEDTEKAILQKQETSSP